jgi:epoxyqueuosine reductase
MPEPGPVERVRERVLALGFDRVGFARAGESADADRFRAWLAAGREADLDYMRDGAEKRADPRRVLPGCRTVLALTLGHFTPDAPSAAEIPGKIARYARGRDYHRVLEPMLKQVVAVLSDECGGATRSRWYVDTGPVLERGWAAAAGVGFTGKNACLIDPRRGSWTSLGVVLTTADLGTDEPVRVTCGTCVRCIDVCPTRAIVAPGVVDSRLCLSYWTIEQRGPIPVELRAALGTRAFGCDDCQDVCPWNRFARPATVADVRPRGLFVDPDLARLAALSREEWDVATRGSAVRRAGYEGLLRNVAVALGNSGDARARPHLERLARHESGLVREHAAWGLARLNDERRIAPRRHGGTETADPGRGEGSA